MNRLLEPSSHNKELPMLRKNKKTNPPELSAHDLLLEDIKKTKFALDTAYANFENVTEPDLIDCYIYELNAAQMRYKFLLKKVKGMTISNSIE